MWQFYLYIKRRDVLLSLLALSLSLLLLIGTAFSDQNDLELSWRISLQLSIVVLVTMQFFLQNTWKLESEDQYLSSSLAASLSPSKVFWSKFFTINILASITFFIALLLLDISQGPLTSSMFWGLAFFAFLSLLALSSIGILLSGVVEIAQSPPLVFPLLYFPLSFPVLICLQQSTLEWINQLGHMTKVLQVWMMVMISFAIIYTALSHFLFDLLMAPTQHKAMKVS